MTSKPPRAQILDVRAKVAMGVLAAVALANLYGISADLEYVSLANDLLGGERVSFEDAEAVDDKFARSATIQLVATLLCAVTFLLWLARAHNNASALGAPPRETKAAALFCWFVPIANLFVPKRVVNDIWRGSDPDDPEPPPPEWRKRRVSGLVQAWWITWLLGGFLGNVLLRRAFNEDIVTPEDLRSEGYGYLVSDAIYIVAAILAILMVREMTERLELRRLRAQDGALPAAPPTPVAPPMAPAAGGGASPPAVPPAAPPAPGTAPTPARTPPDASIPPPGG